MLRSFFRSKYRTTLFLAFLLVLFWLFVSAGSGTIPADTRTEPAITTRIQDSTEPKNSPSPFGSSATVNQNTPLTINESSIPRGLTVDQFKKLRQELAGHPNIDAEIRRVAGHLALMSDLDEFRSLRDKGTKSSALSELIASMRVQLDLMLSSGELIGPEALVLQKELISASSLDPKSQDAALTSWREKNLRFFPPTVGN
jgi:hypothetical protein